MSLRGQLSLFLLLSCLSPSLEADDSTPAISWQDVSSWGVEGQGWSPRELQNRFDRLPAKAEGVVRDAVWNLSRHSSGISFRFNTDSTEIRIRYEVGNSSLSMTNLPATGKSGVDLYAFQEGNWKWVDVTRPKEVKTEHVIEGLDPGMRSYLAYLPLFNTTQSIEIGVLSNAAFEQVAPRDEKPLVFYGTSITHGASASRPGMTHVSILGRRLDLPVVNLGFSGNGRMEPEVGALVAEIDAAAYIIDCLPNMTGDLVAERAEPMVRQIREVRPDIPIVLVEDRTFTNAWIFSAKRKRHQENRTALIRAFDNLVSSGVKQIYYIEGEDLLGDDTEAATDGSHPSDLGFLRQANAFEPILKTALGLN
ncbi:MAG: SGNH/GDSL hydrolase family protein [Verrucomicrobiota bacterium]